MFKKSLIFLLVALMLFSMVACGDKKQEGEQPAKVTETETETKGGGVAKIGIMTGTVSQGEEEFIAASLLKEKYGDRILHVTYPDKFASETETTISNLKGLASDPDVKAIIVCQGIPGTVAGFDAVKDLRDDIWLLAGTAHEDPEVVSSRADLILELNQIQRGESVMKKAKEMGAETFVHYSFPRHMSYVLLSARRDRLKETAKEIGIEFVEVDAPDPTSDAGTAGTQQFILEDVPRMVKTYGKDTAFFGTNCAMMEPLINMCLKEGAIFPEQCCPSPYHAYPGALGIKIPADKAGDIDYLVEQITEIVAENNGTGRFGTWVKPANVSIINAATEYAFDLFDGKVGREDLDYMSKKMEEATGKPVTLETYSIDGKNLDNFALFVLGNQIF